MEKNNVENKVLIVVAVFIILEAIASIVLSKDQLWYSTVGRLLRIVSAALIIAVAK